MNRNELVRKLASRTGYPIAETASFVDAYEKLIMDIVQSGEDIQLHGFMKIESRIKKEYIGNVIGKAGGKVIPEHRCVKLTPGKTLKQCVQ